MDRLSTTKQDLMCSGRGSKITSWFCTPRYFDAAVLAARHNDDSARWQICF